MAEKKQNKRASSKKASPQSKKGSAGENRAAAKKREALGHCFVISPFGGWHDDYYSEVFCPAIKKAGLEPGRADDLFRSSNIVHDIWEAVSSARILLADLTNKNANVFYELGLAHAAKKPVLLLTQSIEDVPFDLRALRVIPYDVEHPAWGKRLEENIVQGLKETLAAPEASVLPTFLVEKPAIGTEVSKDEARYLGLQQQLDSLRAEMRSSRRPQDRSVSASEARTLIRSLLSEGMPEKMIISRVTRLGPPQHWVLQEVRRQIEALDE
jgi:hypothetical protein